jgi:hypothetical protein
MSTNSTVKNASLITPEILAKPDVSLLPLVRVRTRALCSLVSSCRKVQAALSHQPPPLGRLPTSIMSPVEGAGECNHPCKPSCHFLLHIMLPPSTVIMILTLFALFTALNQKILMMTTPATCPQLNCSACHKPIRCLPPPCPLGGRRTLRTPQQSPG